MVADDKPQHAQHHISSLAELWGVFFSLVALTILTVAASTLSLGEWDLIVALVIAGVKASLVVFCFMHLRHDKGFNVILFLGAILFLVLFLSVTLIDISDLNGRSIK